MLTVRRESDGEALVVAESPGEAIDEKDRRAAEVRDVVRFLRFLGR